MLFFVAKDTFLNYVCSSHQIKCQARVNVNAASLLSYTEELYCTLLGLVLLRSNSLLFILIPE